VVGGSSSEGREKTAWVIRPSGDLKVRALGGRVRLREDGRNKFLEAEMN